MFADRATLILLYFRLQKLFISQQFHDEFTVDKWKQTKGENMLSIEYFDIFSYSIKYSYFEILFIFGFFLSTNAAE